ncbi:DUF423 domain-containing protein [Brevibacillus laterosporus]|uniref:Membrane protein n=3 Tax=Brevibacillus TaxID=55080 RepID=A0A0F6Y0R3_BRELA|nr:MULTISPECIES: DUF423 domain-containing protein [Brevibacillus]AIG26867.1 putative membrane protein [Brevibacillus laterosporus LMG 15441]AKF95976.1 membrane protein [Brevibacillus laterosporus]MCR8984684.1 DUF423 domain-containing protein [Brevibacillus laterosporus]MCZ0830410.1 DUF423 domain-containing protein [Brevibacillus halotolerans]MDF9410587.1 DUF423 domain-containing protein [Brevibacillus laterosporus]
MLKRYVTAGAILALLGVALGAFGAHVLEKMLDAKSLATFETGVRYQMYHALGLLFVGLLGKQVGETAMLKWAGTFLLAGILIFSGSLYLLCVTGVKMLGAITPIGGVCFLLGWLFVVLAVRKKS